MPNCYPNTKCSNCGVKGETTQVMPYGQVCGYCLGIIGSGSFGSGSFSAKKAKQIYNRQLKKAGVTQTDLDLVREIDRKLRKALA